MNSPDDFVDGIRTRQSFASERSWIVSQGPPSNGQMSLIADGATVESRSTAAFVPDDDSGLDADAQFARAASHNSERRRSARRAIQTCLPLWLADLTALTMMIASAGVVGIGPAPEMTIQVLSIAWVALSASLCAGHFLTGLYPGCALTSGLELRRIGISCAATGVVIAITLVILRQFTYWSTDAAIIAGAAASLSIGLVLTDWALRRCVRFFFAKYDWWGQRAVVVTDDPRGMEVHDALLLHPELGLRPMGIVSEPDDLRANSHQRLPACYLGPVGDVPAIASSLGVDFGVVVMFRRPPDELRSVLDQMSSATPHLILAPEDADCGRRWYGRFEVAPFTFHRADDHLFTPGARFLKRSFDLLAGVLIGMVLLPVIAAVFLLVKLSSRGPALIWQERVGRDGLRFQCLKFRTMVVDAEAQLRYYLASNPELRAEWEKNRKLKNDPRRIPVLAFLRQAGLDELPQLWHVIRGEMSLVGPRPIFANEIGLFAEQYALYCRVLPGLTGWWQVNGHNHTTFKQRVELDSYYARNWSPWLDVCILLRTIRVVIARDRTW